MGFPPGRLTELLHAWSADAQTALDRAHFLGIGAPLIRRVLVDHARARGYRKRRGGVQRVPLDEGLVPSPDEPPLDLLAPTVVVNWPSLLRP